MFLFNKHFEKFFKNILNIQLTILIFGIKGRICLLDQFLTVSTIEILVLKFQMCDFS